jgi:hypothetical protein
VSRGSLTKRSGQFFECFSAEQRKIFVPHIFLQRQLEKASKVLEIFFLPTFTPEFSNFSKFSIGNDSSNVKSNDFFCFVIGGEEVACLRVEIIFRNSGQVDTKVCEKLLRRSTKNSNRSKKESRRSIKNKNKCEKIHAMEKKRAMIRVKIHKFLHLDVCNISKSRSEKKKRKSM